jgi:ribosomal protein S18 acetylase RimI-like enzyme
MDCSPPSNQAPRPDAAKPPAPPISQLTPADAAAVGEMHRSAIATSFLATLGRGFSKYLYRGVLCSPSAFGFACRADDGRLLGYIACTDSTSTLYKQSLSHHGLMMVIWLLPRIWRISVFRRLWETLRYPFEAGADLPEAEVLSIAVSPEVHGRGIGAKLIAAALAEFRRRGATRVKVAVWAGNTVAIKFYQHCGFQLALTRMHHQKPMNIYTMVL